MHAQEDGIGQGSLACFSLWSFKELNTTERLMVFAFGVCALDVIAKKLLPRLLLRSFFVLFCSRTFTVPGLMFKPDLF